MKIGTKYDRTIRNIVETAGTKRKMEHSKETLRRNARYGVNLRISRRSKRAYNEQLTESTKSELIETTTGTRTGYF